MIDDDRLKPICQGGGASTLEHRYFNDDMEVMYARFDSYLPSSKYLAKKKNFTKSNNVCFCNTANISHAPRSSHSLLPRTPTPFLSPTHPFFFHRRTPRVFPPPEASGTSDSLRIIRRQRKRARTQAGRRARSQSGRRKKRQAGRRKKRQSNRRRRK